MKAASAVGKGTWVQVGKRLVGWQLGHSRNVARPHAKLQQQVCVPHSRRSLSHSPLSSSTGPVDSRGTPDRWRLTGMRRQPALPAGRAGDWPPRTPMEDPPTERAAASASSRLPSSVTQAGCSAERGAAAVSAAAARPPARPLMTALPGLRGGVTYLRSAEVRRTAPRSTRANAQRSESADREELALWRLVKCG